MLTCFSIAAGRKIWNADLGIPLWALNTEKGIICAAEKDNTVTLMLINKADGKPEWRYKGLSVFPGQKVGNFVFCTDNEHVLKIDMRNGKKTEETSLKKCLFPGSVIVGELFYIVNTGGIFAYASK
jgi:outer membrane protein assembly factor BamB